MSTISIPKKRDQECENLLNRKVPSQEFFKESALINLRDAHTEGTLSDIPFVKLICYFPVLVDGKEEEFKRAVENIRSSEDPRFKETVDSINGWIQQEGPLRSLFMNSPFFCDI